MFLFGIIVLANFWFWKIAAYNLILLFVLILTSFEAYRSFNVDKIRYGAIVLYIILLLFQLKTTEITKLTALNNDQITIQQVRINEYPPVNLNFFGKTIWFPIANWFEQRPETIMTPL